MFKDTVCIGGTLSDSSNKILSADNVFGFGEKGINSPNENKYLSDVGYHATLKSLILHHMFQVEIVLFNVNF